MKNATHRFRRFALASTFATAGVAAGSTLLPGEVVDAHVQADPFGPDLALSLPEADPVVPAHHTVGGAENAPAGHELRTVYVDLQPFTGEPGGEYVTYDFTEATRPLTVGQLRGEDDASTAVRLILSEVGVGRVLDNQYGLLEGAGVIWTVHNRLEGVTADPGLTAHAWPGCGKGGDMASCANPQQFHGMSTAQGLRPLTTGPKARVAAAADLAIAAWWMVERGLIEDFTGSATSFVHRCGGAKYGSPTTRCSGKGANPTTGPLLFKAIAGQSSRGYVHRASRAIDWATDGSALQSGDFTRYLDRPHPLTVPA